MASTITKKAILNIKKTVDAYNKEMALINAKQNIRSIQDVEKPSLLGTLLGVAAAYVDARDKDEQKLMMREKAGVITNKEYTPAVSSPTPSAPLYKATTYDWNSCFDLRNTTTHFHFNYRDPFAGVQQSYW